MADINYLDENAQPKRVDGARLPWSLELVTMLTAVAANVVAQGDSDTIGCRITVNGVVRQQQSQLRRSLRGLGKEGFRHIFVLNSAEEVEAAAVERVPLYNDKRHEHGPFDIIGDIHG